VKILSQWSSDCKNFAQGPPTRLSVASTHSEKGLLLSPSTGKLHSHRAYNKGAYYITQCQYIVLLLYDVCTCTWSHVERAPIRSRSANRDKNVENNEKTRTDVKHLKLSEGVHGGSGNSGMIENILLGYFGGRIGIQLCCRQFNVYFVRLYYIQSEIADSRLADCCCVDFG